jgi:hypothetical protein
MVESWKSLPPELDEDRLKRKVSFPLRDRGDPGKVDLSVRSGH